MSRFRFDVLSAAPAPHTAAPAVTFRVRLTSDATVRTLVLRCQIQIDARARRYAADEEPRLYELFGQPSQWDHTLRSLVWTTATVVVPAFEREIDFDLVAACSYDLHVAAANYLHGVRGADVPLSFLFSGTAFLVDANALQLQPVSWDSEAAYRMEGGVWAAAIDRFFPGRGWIVVGRETIDALQAFKGQQALLTWDETMEALLRRARAEEPV